MGTVGTGYVLSMQLKGERSYGEYVFVQSLTFPLDSDTNLVQIMAFSGQVTKGTETWTSSRLKKRATVKSS